MLDRNNIVSYWKLDVDFIVYANEEEGFYVIYGEYDHKNSGNPRPAIGICWQDSPKSHNVLSPLVLDNVTANALLKGLVSQNIDKIMTISTKLFK